MALATSQGNSPFLAHLPQALPRTQAEWQSVLNALQAWGGAISATKWLTPTLQNGWQNFGAPFQPAGYYMDPAGTVHLRGLLKSGTVGHTTPIFTLPAGYAPQYEVIVPAVTSADVFGEIRIASGTAGGGAAAGAVAVWSGNNTWISLSGISFSTAV